MVSRFSLCFMSQITWRILVELLLEIIRAAQSLWQSLQMHGAPKMLAAFCILLYGYVVCKTFTFLSLSSSGAHIRAAPKFGLALLLNLALHLSNINPTVRETQA